MIRLIYVNPLGKNSNSKFVYEFYFSESPDDVWGIDWECKPASICNLDIPIIGIDEIRIVETDLMFNVAQKNSCYSMQDCKDQIIPVVWENIDDYEEYPEPDRVVFHFGQDIGDVEKMLTSRDIEITNKKYNESVL